MSLKFILATAVLFITSLSFAQDYDPAALDSVIIKGDRISIPFGQSNRSSYVITKEDVARLPATTISEILSLVPGVDVRQRGPRGSQADIGIDGGGFDQTLLLLNGHRITDPQTGHNLLNIPVPLIAIDRIEVLKGAAARSYGINALGGAINIVTIDQEEKGLVAQAEAGSSFQKNDSSHLYNNQSIEVAGFFGNQQLHNTLALSYNQSNGYRPNTDYEKVQAIYSGSYTKAQQRITYIAGYTSNGFGANNFYAPPADSNASEKVQVAFAAADAQLKIGKSWTFIPKISYRYAKDHFVLNEEIPSFYQNTHETNTIDAALNNKLQLSKNSTLGFGIQLRTEQINSSNLGKNTRNNTGFFGEYRIQATDRFDINLGAYANYNDIYGFKIYPGVDIGYQLHHLRFYANLSTGQRLPTFTDLYYNGPTNVGNPNLEPEWLTTYEAGFRYQEPLLLLSGSVFLRDGKDFIDWSRSSISEPWQPHNITNLQTLGATVSFTFSQQLAINRIFSISSGYTYLDPKISSDTEEESQYVLSALRHQWTSSLQLDAGSHWSISATQRFQYRYQAGKKLDGYARLSYFLYDAKLSYKLGNCKIFATVTNITGVRYIERGIVPMPGAWYSFGVSLGI